MNKQDLDQAILRHGTHPNKDANVSETFTGISYGPLSIRDICSQMGDNLRRWYPDMHEQLLIMLSAEKVIEEYTEWDNASYSEDAEECADIVIALCGYCSQAGIDLQAEIERKLAIVSARTDQPERDRERGIG